MTTTDDDAISTHKSRGNGATDDDADATAHTDNAGGDDVDDTTGSDAYADVADTVGRAGTHDDTAGGIGTTCTLDIDAGDIDRVGDDDDADTTRADGDSATAGVRTFGTPMPAGAAAGGCTPMRMRGPRCGTSTRQVLYTGGGATGGNQPYMPRTIHNICASTGDRHPYACCATNRPFAGV